MRVSSSVIGVVCFFACGQYVRADEPDVRAAAIAAIKAVEGSWLEDQDSPGRSIIKVKLENTAANDDTVAALARIPTINHLNLAGAKVTDRGVSQLARLTNLEELSLARTAVTDRGLESLKPLQNIRTLILNSTKITDAGLKHLDSWQRLESLHLYGTRITHEGMLSLATIDSLRTLTIAQTDVLLPDLRPLCLHGLVHAVIDGRQALEVKDADLAGRNANALNDDCFFLRREICWTDEPPQPDEMLKQELLLAGCRVERSEFDFGHRIQAVEVPARCDLRVVQRGLPTMDRLERLVMREQEISDRFFALPFPSQSRLTELTLIDCRVSEHSFYQTQRFRRLRVLELAGVDYDDKKFAPLFEAPLQRLTLSEVKNSDAALLVATKNFRDSLQVLKLSVTKISEASVQGLGECRQLRRISITDSPLADEAMPAIARLPQLERLDLDFTTLTSAGLRAIQGHAALEELNLAGTKVDDAGLVVLADLPQLRRLNLSYTDVTDAGLRTLASCKNLRSIGLRGTQVTPVGISRLALKLPQISVLE